MAEQAPVNNFMGDLLVKYIDGRRWEVAEGFTYRIGDPNSRTLVRIPRGFVTDFASMPFGVIFRSPGGKWDKPAVVHDLLYKQGYVESDLLQKRITRKDADDIFKEAMQVAGVNWFARQVIYAGVRMGGHNIWAKYRWVDTDVETSA
jgi:hypothetical protein